MLYMISSRDWREFMKIDRNTSTIVSDTTNQNNVNKKKDTTANTSDTKDTASARDNGSIFAGDLNLGSDIDNKRREAQNIALNILENAFKSDKKIDDEIESRNNHVKELNDQINEANDMINNINKEMDIIKKGYNIDDASEEQADYKLLLKEKNSLSNSEITLSDEEQERLAYLHERGLTDYQKEMLNLEANKGIYKKEIKDCTKEIISENAIVRGIHIERLKSHDMTDAQKNSDKVLEASNKEIIGMLIEDSKESIDKKFEDEEKKAEDKKEAEKELEQRIEAAKTERNEKADYKDDDLEEMYKLDSTLDNVVNSQQDSTMDDVKKSLTQVINELNLTADDLKGAVIDKDV